MNTHTAFAVPSRCNTASVNKALKAAGVDTTVFRDPYNDHKYTLVYAVDENADAHLKTGCETARELAEMLAAGEYDLA